MISKCSSGIVSWLIDCGTVEADDRELYEYAIHCLWLNIAPMILVLLFGCIAGRVVEGILFIIPFMAIRKFAGGYHAPKEWQCMVSSCLILVICIYLTGHIRYSALLDGFVLLSVMSLMVFSPMDTENRRLDANEVKRYKRITCIIVSVFTIIYFILVAYRIHHVAVCISMGLMLSAGVQIPCILNQILKIEY